jgi:hypothetical protein
MSDQKSDKVKQADGWNVGDHLRRLQSTRTMQPTGPFLNLSVYRCMNLTKQKNMLVVPQTYDQL